MDSIMQPLVKLAEAASDLKTTIVTGGQEINPRDHPKLTNAIINHQVPPHSI